ncbi:hypothetical protein [Shouchella clausii]|uniref:hypothetical protein n=1 Tax=Shouchella clausii TaxID=79880 RepID=UPI00079BA565|nr:hypothetical protein [Shouchella clausii]KKI85320.1 hypothetical protein WZ76_15765 [Shouchella clausii]
MKKQGIVLSVSVCVLLYLFIENSHLKNEIVHLKEERQEQLDAKGNFNVGAAESAEAFIKAYFTYNGKPQEEEVKPYATSKALDLLQFGDAEGLGENDEEVESIESSTKNVNVYLGKSSDDRQKVAVIFDNEITFNKIKSTASTIMELDMIVDKDIWKVDNFTFNQF